MSSITYFVAMPVLVDEYGELFTGKAEECRSAPEAIRRASRLAGENFGAVAFSRTGDPLLGEFEPAVVLARHGSLPADVADIVADAA